MEHTIFEISKFGKNQSRIYKIDFLKSSKCYKTFVNKHIIMIFSIIII
ncbi:hypothetical protein BGAPBR_I0050 (plasmid) [Borreliella garinii PBr]|uniref:Uncharacterized protein n=1 Tax=Borreliella garinii PBr TaxID=498743 RepID=B8F130_BORGR|nr:hypothetical protein BGAPBR_I0050 [Borreliella garinii PBr]